MHPSHESLLRARRDFLTGPASGIGLLALAALLRDDGLLAAEPAPAAGSNPLAPRPPPLRRSPPRSPAARPCSTRLPRPRA